MRTRRIGSNRSRHVAAMAVAALGIVGLGASGALLAQVPEAVGANGTQTAQERFTPAELDDLVGPIALYPDDIIAIVLPASAYPLEVVEAARFESRRKKDPTLEPNPDWDDSVVALLNYPEVLERMNDDLEWTARLGDAVATQQADVFDAIQRFRDLALASGNLRTDGHQVVSHNDGAVEIRPADPMRVYVPYYEPSRVILNVYSPIAYYPYAYPLYYYPYPAGYSFGTGFFFGVTTAFVIGWHTHYIHVDPWYYTGHPYYGRHYYAPFYVRRSVNVHVRVVDGGHGALAWRPDRDRRANRGGFAWRNGGGHGQDRGRGTSGRLRASGDHGPGAAGGRFGATRGRGGSAHDTTPRAPVRIPRAAPRPDDPHRDAARPSYDSHRGVGSPFFGSHRGGAGHAQDSHRDGASGRGSTFTGRGNSTGRDQTVHRGGGNGGGPAHGRSHERHEVGRRGSGVR